MLSHSFDQFYIVMKYELPKTEDLKLTTFKFDYEFSYTNSTGTNTNYAFEILHENHIVCMTSPKANTIL